jgi:hypothetical protein
VHHNAALWFCHLSSRVDQLSLFLISLDLISCPTWVNESRYKTLDRFRSRTSKTTWKWRVVPMYGYATPFSRRLWRPRPRSKSVCRWESFAFDHQLSSTFNCELVQILTRVDESFQTFTCSKRILGSLSFTFPGTANGRFELSWQNFRWTFSKA